MANCDMRKQEWRDVEKMLSGFEAVIDQTLKASAACHKEQPASRMGLCDHSYAKKEDNMLQYLTKHDVIEAINEVSKFGMLEVQTENKLRDNISEVLKCLEPLECCLRVNGSSKLTKESSWINFHSTVTSVSLPFLSLAASRLLCVKVFNCMVSRKWPVERKSSTVPDITFDTADCEILSYIGGSIVHKLHAKYGKGPQQQFIDRLKTSSNDYSSSFSNLIRAKDRGGLTFITKKAEQLFCGMEKIFRQLLRYDTIHASKTMYLKSCFQTLRTIYLDSITIDGQPLDQQEHDASNTFHDIAVLFFKIRIHHRCKILIEQFKSKGRKGLRKSLQQSKQ